MPQFTDTKRANTRFIAAGRKKILRMKVLLYRYCKDTLRHPLHSRRSRLQKTFERSEYASKPKAG
jgi:hypothetical protein